jgi:hypothetical protein
MDSVTLCQDRLHSAGWSTTECILVLVGQAVAWQVSCSRAGHLVVSMAPSQAEAWEAAWRQVEAIGLRRQRRRTC